MLSAYTPTLKKPTEYSADWYRNFHNIFYLSQVTNLTLLSYMDSLIHQDQGEIIKELKDSLIKEKIISFDEENNSYSIRKESAFKAIHIEDTLQQIVDNVILSNYKQKRMLLLGMGLDLDGDEDKEIHVNLDALLNTTSSKNWYDLLRGLLNVWEFLFLYGMVESTFKNILGKNGVVREEALIQEILNKFEDLEKNIGLSKSDIGNLWNLYTEFRNIYSHSHGLITDMAKSNLGGKLDKARESLRTFYGSEISITNIDGIFNKNLIKKDKFYFLKDDELNIFRNLIIIFMESLDSSLSAKES
jgi:hypothetical protein